MKLWGGLALLGALMLTGSGCWKDAGRVTLSTPPLQVVDRYGDVQGLDRMDEFMQRAVQGQAAAVRVRHYTVEGDPIDYDIAYDGAGAYQVRYDTTKDKFGKGGVKTYSCGNFVKTETDTSSAYTAEKCTGGQERIMVLDIGYDVSAQDRFEFVLQYGANGEKTLRSDQLSKGQLQETYKALVLANYLFVNDLSTACKEEPNDRYKLTMWINGGTREYAWASCDNSTDGKAMTGVMKQLLAMKKEG